MLMRQCRKRGDYLGFCHGTNISRIIVSIKPELVGL
jgi:hypothetical protein